MNASIMHLRREQTNVENASEKCMMGLSDMLQLERMMMNRDEERERIDEEGEGCEIKENEEASGDYDDRMAYLCNGLLSEIDGMKNWVNMTRNDVIELQCHVDVEMMSTMKSQCQVIENMMNRLKSKNITLERMIENVERRFDEQNDEMQKQMDDIFEKDTRLRQKEESLRCVSIKKKRHGECIYEKDLN